MYTERHQWIAVTVKRFPDDTPSNGFASGLIDYGQEHHVLHEVIMDDTGEIWYCTNGQVRVRPNPSMKAKRVALWSGSGGLGAKAET